MPTQVRILPPPLKGIRRSRCLSEVHDAAGHLGTPSCAQVTDRASWNYASRGHTVIPMFDDRVIAIAGVGGGLGPVVAERPAAAGATVAGTVRSQEHLDSLAADLDLPVERWDGRVVDLLDE